MKTTLLRKVLGFLVGLLVLAAAGVALYTWGALKFTYSTGDRVGYVQKFSKKGWLCKTWEGELAMVTLPGAIPEKFYFSVRDQGTADEINRLLGRRVYLKYVQHRGVPTTCFGETEYFVDAVKLVE
ncbi:hypothetical protein [Anaeromyxobacter paludicola]|uniref:6-phosphogluconate dehydrogenase n=1 Tax=Anaeromyxobacter paludicola TaxID=2918171 RepID=A0ABM7XFL6_9BACT|nr:hypothetical protein [Anaeromyxobacter paludicola]BDG10701.1 hypothetical protein AMPC_38140 [Anaeromyxobacter paludicola]